LDVPAQHASNERYTRSCICSTHYFYCIFFTKVQTLGVVVE
jgi:hypothetical protein